MKTVYKVNVEEVKKRYLKIITSAPRSKNIVIYACDTKIQAENKSKKLRSWPFKVITRARTKDGRFTNGFVLICCK